MASTGNFCIVASRGARTTERLIVSSPCIPTAPSCSSTVPASGSSTARFNGDRGRYDLCVDGEVCEFASGTTRVFRLNDAATDRGTQGDVPGGAP
jgi:hypothetical protein